MKKLHARSTGLIASFVSILILSACEAPTTEADYRLNHAIEVVQETKAISFMDQNRDQSLSGPEQARFDRFIRTYHLSGQGFMTVLADGDTPLKTSRTEAMQDLLLRAGVTRNLIRALPFSPEKDSAITLSFVANVAKVPECDDWEKSPTFNWTNSGHSNFGCATQRNLGLTVANPGDLKGANTMDNADGSRGAAIIDGYRSPAAAVVAP